MLSKEKINNRLKIKNIPYQALEDAENQKAIIKFKHIDCGTEFDAIVERIVSGDRKCPNCKKHKKWDSKRVMTFINSNRREYSLVNPKNSEHIRSHDRIEISHTCGNTYTTELSNFVNGGYLCPFCSSNNLRKNYKDTFKDIVEKVPGYKLLGQYISCNEKVRFFHENCGKEFEMRPENFIQGQRCPNCRKNKPYNLTSIKEKINEVVGDEYQLVSEEYTNISRKYKLFHRICNKTFETNLVDFISGGHRCPYCKTFSKGELGIRNFLERNNIRFAEQYTFDDLRSSKNRLLRFDFAILNDDETLKELIEFDGSHHFNDYGRPENFKYIKERDELKNRYCINNGIKLTRIKYWENVENRLNEVFNFNINSYSSTTNPDECKGVGSSDPKRTTERSDDIV